MEAWWAAAVPYSEIARRLGCDWSTVRDHVRQHILPKWREMEGCQREALEAQVSHMQQVAMAKFEQSTQPQTRKTIERALTKEGGLEPQVVKRVLQKISRTGEVCWWQVFQWCIDWKTRVGGHYAATKVEISGLRSAGMTPEEHRGRMLERLREAYRSATGTAPRGRAAKG